MAELKANIRIKAIADKTIGKSVEQTRKEFNSIGKTANRAGQTATRSTQKLGQSLTRAGTSAGRLSRNIGDSVKATSKLGRIGASAGASLDRLGNRWVALAGTIGTGAVIRQIGNLQERFMRQSLKEKKTRSFNDITIGDLIKTISAEHGLTPKIAVNMSATIIKHIDQTNESDLHFLTRLAKERDAVAKLMMGYLIFAPRGQAKSISGKTIPAVSLVKKDINSWRMRGADRGKYPAVMAKYYDQTTAKTINVTAGTGQPVRKIRKQFSSLEAANAAASAELLAIERGTSTLSLTLQGRGDLMAEGKLTLTDLRDGVNGEWIIRRVEHTINDTGYSCRIEAEAAK